MQTQRTAPGAFMEAKNLYLTAGVVMALAFCNALHAQSTSYNANTVPISGDENCAFGQGALLSNTTGFHNVATGFEALYSNTGASHNTANGFRALYSNKLGSENTAIGFEALTSNTTGAENVANGANTLWSNMTGNYNNATGSNALYSNTSGSYNVANGAYALYTNTTGTNNNATGGNALGSNTIGSDNIANGFYALYSNKTGNRNIASGTYALYSNTTGYYNVANGYKALYNNTTGGYNNAYGIEALFTNTTGFNNIAIGYKALYYSSTGNNNVAQGYYALYNNKTGERNTAIGYNTFATNQTGSYNTGLGNAANVSTDGLTNATVIGSYAVVNASNKIRLGNADVTIVEGPVVYTVSDGRFKTDVKEEDVKGLEFITKLRPVVYNFDTRKLTEFLTKNMPDSIRKQHLDKDFTASTNIRQSGFIAQEVEKAAKEVNYDFNGVHTPDNENDNYSLAYAEFVVPLVKAVQEQQKMIDDQKKINEVLQQQIEELQKGKGSTTGINDGLSVIGASMAQNVPNPFSRETVIGFNLPQQVSNAFMTVYDLSGREIKTLPIHQRGASSITVTADQLEAGMYIYSITADGQIVDSKRMVVAGK